MINISYILTVILFVLIVYLLFTRKKKTDLAKIKELVWNSSQDIQEAHKSLEKTHKRLDELYRAIQSIEEGKVNRE